MKFKIGDIVMLKACTRDFGAEDGATAVVKAASLLFIHIKWVRENELCKQQRDGNYEVGDFILVNKIKKEIKPFGICAFVTNYYK